MWGPNRSKKSSRSVALRWLTGLLAGCAFLCVASLARADAPGDGGAARVVEDGRKLFTREWLPGDSTGHQGDGLGPMFNDTSCVACHNQGGGGAGEQERRLDHRCCDTR
jgi:hypothetical protein